MEVWDLLRPSFRRLMALALAAVLAAVGAVLVEHARAAQYDGHVSVYFAQALGVDTTSFSVDPTADQVTSVLKLPAVQSKAAATGGVPLGVVRAATITHDTGSPIIEITAKGSQEQAVKAAPALAAAGLEYFAQQGVARAQSVQASATADLATINAELAAFTTRAGVSDVDAAVANAAAAVASAQPETAAATVAAANLARLQALQPQYDLLTTEVTGARASVSQAYSAVGTAQSVAKAVQLPGNVVTAPVTPASRVTAYLRAAVGAAVVVVVLGAAFVVAVELRRRRTSGRVPAPAAVSTGGVQPAAAAPTTAAADAADDFPLVVPAGEVSLEPPHPEVVPPTAPPVTSPSPAPVAEAPIAEPPSAAEPPPDEVSSASRLPVAAPFGDPYLAQARRFVLEQQQHEGAARQAKEERDQRRAVRDALQRAERATDAVAEPPPSVLGVDAEQAPAADAGEPADERPIAPVHPLFGERARTQIRVLTAVPDPADEPGEGRATSGS